MTSTANYFKSFGEPAASAPTGKLLKFLKSGQFISLICYELAGQHTRPRVHNLIHARARTLL
jgi:hypothetical protein